MSISKKNQNRLWAVWILCAITALTIAIATEGNEPFPTVIYPFFVIAIIPCVAAVLYLIAGGTYFLLRALITGKGPEDD